jgi:uncharacterized protein (TIGR02117 family)
MGRLRILVKGILVLLGLPILYVLLGLGLSEITINTDQSQPLVGDTIFLTTNGLHLDIVMPIESIDSNLLKDLKYDPVDRYLAFGWGDENFYLNTPTWADLTFKNAVKAIFLKSTSLIHLSRYQRARSQWVAVPISEKSLQQLNAHLQKEFTLNQNGAKVILTNQGYGPHDDFYKAKGSYSFFKTCNT